jgi:hypothetical protein
VKEAPDQADDENRNGQLQSGATRKVEEFHCQLPVNRLDMETLPEQGIPNISII